MAEIVQSHNQNTGFATARVLPASSTSGGMSHAESFMGVLFQPNILHSRSPIQKRNDSAMIDHSDTSKSQELQQPVQERLYAQHDKYKTQAEIRKAQ